MSPERPAPMTRRIDLPAAVLPAPGESVRITSGERAIALFRTESGLFALDARCSHLGGPLDRGRVENGRVTCPWHGSVFDLATGAAVRGPAHEPVRPYRARVDGDRLILESE
jgi:nitrite reductase/ring-hydroxylating ferredoxin subunit